jgi:hypothetical protein
MLAFHTAADRVFSTNVAIGKPMSDLALAVQEIRSGNNELSFRLVHARRMLHRGCQQTARDRPPQNLSEPIHASASRILGRRVRDRRD